MVTLPAIGKPHAFIKRDVAMLGAFRDHPQVAAVLEQKRIGQVPRLLQDRRHPADRAGAIEFDGRNNASADPMVEILEKYKCSSLPLHRKRIGEEAMPWIRKHLPVSSGQVAGLPDPGALTIPPSDMPMRRIAAQPVDFLRN